MILSSLIVSYRNQELRFWAWLSMHIRAIWILNNLEVTDV